MKPRIRKAAGTGWWCDDGAIVGYGGTACLAYLNWKAWVEELTSEVLEARGYASPSSPKEDNQDQTRRE